jgi:hypothetical protein
MMVKFEMSGPIDRIDEHSWRATDRAHRRDEISPGYAAEFGDDFRKLRDRQVAENAVETKSDVNRGVLLGQPVEEIGDLKREVYGWESGEITRQSPGSLNLRERDIEAACGDFGEAEPVRMRHNAAQPRAWPAAGIEARNGTRACRSQFTELFLDKEPQTAIRVAMKTIEAKQSRRVTVRVSDIIVTGLVVDRGDVPAGERVWRPIRGV